MKKRKKIKINKPQINIKMKIILKNRTNRDSDRHQCLIREREKDREMEKMKDNMFELKFYCFWFNIKKRFN